MQPLEKLTDKHSRIWGIVTHLKVCVVGCVWGGGGAVTDWGGGSRERGQGRMGCIWENVTDLPFAAE